MWKVSMQIDERNKGKRYFLILSVDSRVILCVKMCRAKRDWDKSACFNPVNELDAIEENYQKPE